VVVKQPNRGTYPPDWKAIARRVKDDAGWCCIRCHHPHCPMTGHTLTVHHADADKENVAWWNLLALCQRCHLSVQGRVVLARPWLLTHSEWFKPYVAGFYAHKYLGEQLSRDEVMARLDTLLALETDSLIEVSA
jgi:hypothetical protein